MPVETIYVKLVDEAVDVWRPVRAEVESGTVYRLPAVAPNDEIWAFPPGSRVRCERQSLSEGSALVAISLVQ